jgi:hypothetical protein
MEFNEILPNQNQHFKEETLIQNQSDQSGWAEFCTATKTSKSQ